MDDAQEPSEATAKPRRKIEFEEDVYDIEDSGESSSKPWVYMSHEMIGLPKYSDGTSFPANFLKHETVLGYPSDKWPQNDGVDDVLDITSLFENEGLRCCILDVVALQYYGSERLRTVSIIITRLYPSTQFRLYVNANNVGLVGMRTYSLTFEGNRPTSGQVSEIHAVRAGLSTSGPADK